MTDKLTLADYPGACQIALDGGAIIATDAYPADVSFLAVFDADGTEIAYWSIDEVVESAAEVLGAFFGCVRNLQGEVVDSV